jgi:protein-S-isoprenylcysteine O-methyltransferase Ste14
MANPQIDAIDKELHPQAEKTAKQYINEFATSLLLQAKITAYRSKADVVLSSHVDEALDTINRGRKQIWSRELVIIIGSALLGAFIQGFISERSSGNSLLIATYVVLGFVGMFLVFWGLRR